jgi:hypothetical protein
MIFSKTNPPSGFYVYAYLRSKDSKIAKAGTPYYIGKGYDQRAWKPHRSDSGGPHVPKNNHNIII